MALDPGLHEQQVGLLCRFDPPGLQAFLETSQLYPLEAAVKVGVVRGTRGVGFRGTGRFGLGGPGGGVVSGTRWVWLGG